MSDLGILDYCDDLQAAIASVRLSFRTTINESEILDVYWRLQDQLHRIVDLASDSPHVIGELGSAYPTLVRDVVRLLQATIRVHFSRISAVEVCCETINSYLIELEQLKQLYRVKVASS